jgi:hypothetical protein
VEWWRAVGLWAATDFRRMTAALRSNLRALRKMVPSTRALIPHGAQARCPDALWLPIRTLGANLTNDEKRAHLIDLRRDHLIDQVCIQEVLPPEK